MTNPIIGKGSQLQLSIAGVYTKVAAVLNLDPPDPEVQTYDATTLDTGVGRSQKPTGYTEAGKVSGSILFDPADATHKQLLALLAAPAVSNWKIIFADMANTVWPFNGVLTKCAPKIVMDDGVKADFEITLDGLPAYPS